VSNETSPYDCDPAFVSLRDRVFSLTAGDLGVPDSTPVLAVLMEMGFPEAVVTLVSVVDGSTSLYFSTGGGMIGSGEHADVATVSKQFVQDVGESDFGFADADTRPLPLRGSVRFYVVRPGEVVTTEASEDELGNNRHALSPLFHRAQEVISAVREHGG